jgi:K+ transporter
MAPWRDRLFIFMHRNASDPSIHFGLPREQSVDIGTHVGI